MMSLKGGLKMAFLPERVGKTCRWGGAVPSVVRARKTLKRWKSEV